MEERLNKWRLILGKKADESHEHHLPNDLREMDEVLEALYDSDKKGGLGSSSPNVNRWLGDIRKYFPTSVVQMMQKDALERLDLQQMLLEPEMLENLEPDVNLVATLLSLKKVIPTKTRDTARKVVERVVRDLEARLTEPMRQSIKGALSRSVRNTRPKPNEIDWNKTVRANLKHYQTDYRTVIPHRLIGYGRKGQALKHVVLLVDQSGSMATSVVYSGIFGAVMASIRAIKTHFIVFDTAVVDLTETLDDPIELLFSTQLGGGTDINKALAYTETLVSRPHDTVLVLITDLYEGGNAQEMLQRFHHLTQLGVQIVVLLALSDEGAPMYDKKIAGQLAVLDIPSFACTPDQFPNLMATVLQKKSLTSFLKIED